MNLELVSILMIIVFFIIGFIVGGALARSDMKNSEPCDGTITVYEEDGKCYQRFYSFESIKDKRIIRLRVIKK